MSPSSILTAAAMTHFVVLHGLELAMTLASVREIRRQRTLPKHIRRSVLRDSGLLPGISVVVPAFNEQSGIVRTVAQVLASDYPDLEVVVVNDGSTDHTLGQLLRAYSLTPSTKPGGDDLPSQKILAAFRSRRDPRLVVLDKRNGGKADALNAGISASSRRLVCVVDADVLLAPSSLIDLADPFVRDRSTIASSGPIRLQGSCRIRLDGGMSLSFPRHWLEGFQTLEYVRAFTLGRLFFEHLGAHLLVSGAFGLFRRSALVEIGGYQTQAIGEDFELVVRLHRHFRGAMRAYRIAFVVDALCLTEAPRSVADLGTQRTRWHQGLLATLRLHRDLLSQWRYGRVAWLALSYYVYELLAPLLTAATWIAVLGAWSTGLLDGRTVLAIGTAVLAMTVVSSTTALGIDAFVYGHHRQPRPLTLLSLLGWLEPIVYRPLIVYFQLRAFVRFYAGFHLFSGWRSPSRNHVRPNQKGQA